MFASIVFAATTAWAPRTVEMGFITRCTGCDTAWGQAVLAYVRKRLVETKTKSG